MQIQAILFQVLGSSCDVDSKHQLFVFCTRNKAQINIHAAMTRNKNNVFFLLLVLLKRFFSLMTPCAHAWSLAQECLMSYQSSHGLGTIKQILASLRHLDAYGYGLCCMLDVGWHSSMYVRHFILLDLSYFCLSYLRANTCVPWTNPKSRRGKTKTHHEILDIY